MVGKGFRIGRLYGINIRVDISWLLIVALITWNLTTVFGQLHPEWNVGLRWALSIVAALLFFASVLAHELAHSIVARAQGLPVRNITLFLFGGVAAIQREPPSPKAEFLIAAAGPAMSLLIGASMIGIAFASLTTNGLSSSPGGLIARLSPASTLLFWLGSINIILAIFNMIPGFPLDGGRVLRSILWAVLKNLRNATRIASWIGQTIAWTLIFAGIAMVFGVRFPVLGGGVFNGLWLAFIGWFLNSASVQSYQQVAVQDMLQDIPVSQIMSVNATTVDPAWELDNLFRLFNNNQNQQSFPVVEENRLVGIISMEQARRIPRQGWRTTLISDVMIPARQLATVTPDEDAAAAMEKLIQRDVHQLPVIQEDSEYIGLLRRNDILQWLQYRLKKRKNRIR